jgi:formyltetrahydrofolate hydrolase
MDPTATCATLDLPLQYLDKTCNIRPKQLKHLQHTFETPGKTCVAIAKYMQHPNETLATYV